MAVSAVQLWISTPPADTGPVGRKWWSIGLVLHAAALFVAAIAAFPKNRALVVGVYVAVWFVAQVSLTVVTARRRR